MEAAGAGKFRPQFGKKRKESFFRRLISSSSIDPIQNQRVFAIRLYHPEH